MEKDKAHQFNSVGELLDYVEKEARRRAAEPTADNKSHATA